MEIPLLIRFRTRKADFARSSFLRKFLVQILHELFSCLNFLQKEMSAVLAQDTCSCGCTMFIQQYFSNITHVSHWFRHDRFRSGVVNLRPACGWKEVFLLHWWPGYHENVISHREKSFDVEWKPNKLVNRQNNSSLSCSSCEYSFLVYYRLWKRYTCIMQLKIKKLLTWQIRWRSVVCRWKKITHVYFHPQGCLLVRANTNDGSKHLKYRITSAWKLPPFCKK